MRNPVGGIDPLDYIRIELRGIRVWILQKMAMPENFTEMHLICDLFHHIITQNPDQFEIIRIIEDNSKRSYKAVIRRYVDIDKKPIWVFRCLLAASDTEYVVRDMRGMAEELAIYLAPVSDVLPIGR